MKKNKMNRLINSTSKYLATSLILSIISLSSAHAFFESAESEYITELNKKITDLSPYLITNSQGHQLNHPKEQGRFLKQIATFDDCKIRYAITDGHKTSPTSLADTATNFTLFLSENFTVELKGIEESEWKMPFIHFIDIYSPEDGPKVQYKIFVPSERIGAEYIKKLSLVHQLCNKKFDYLFEQAKSTQQKILKQKMNSQQEKECVQEMLENLSPLKAAETDFIKGTIDLLNKNELEKHLDIFNKNFNVYKSIDAREPQTKSDEKAIEENVITIIDLLINHPEFLRTIDISQFTDFIKIAQRMAALLFKNNETESKISNLFLKFAADILENLKSINKNQSNEILKYLDSLDLSKVSDQENLFNKLKLDNDLIWISMVYLEYLKHDLQSRLEDHKDSMEHLQQEKTQKFEGFEEVVRETQLRTATNLSLFLSVHKDNLRETLHKLLMLPMLNDEEVEKIKLKEKNIKLARLKHAFEYYERYGTIGQVIKNYLKTESKLKDIGK
ncbi:MAG: hypothetical protein HQK51_11345 [Oligoflexia bacterium]|nr:hypothetical protein [Oligoflexia bacterium]